MTRFGDRVRTFRKKKGMTQVQLAQRIGVSPASLSGMELNKDDIPQRLYEPIARALGIRTADLMVDLPADTLHRKYWDRSYSEDSEKTKG